MDRFAAWSAVVRALCADENNLIPTDLLMQLFKENYNPNLAVRRLMVLYKQGVHADGVIERAGMEI